MTERVGIVAAARYLPWFRLTQDEIARTQRTPSRRATERRLAGYDEDALTMSVAAARMLPVELLDRVRELILTTTTPPYLVKNNASAAHAALGLAADVAAYDAGGAYRSAAGAFAVARTGTLQLFADVTTALPGAATELSHGDAAAALIFGPADDSVAIVVDTIARTDEVLDQWRLPAQASSSMSEERFPLSHLVPAVQQAIRAVTARVDHVVVSAASPRVASAVGRVAASLGPVRSTPGVGFTGSADLAVQLCQVLAIAEPGERIALISAADGCDIVVLECTSLLADRRPRFDRQAGEGAVPTYFDALAWRGLLRREPPRRPEPAPVSPAVAGRRTGWKFGLHGSRCGSCGAVASPPQRACVRCSSTDTAERIDLSREGATIRTFSVDRLAFSPNPPMVAAVIDFDTGGRLEVELTDTDPERLAVGGRVQMALRLRHSSGGIHNYAWKAILKGFENG